MPIRRGGVWLCDFDEHPDSRQNGIRPCVVVQTDHLNKVANYTLTIVVPLSTKGSERIPSHARIMPDDANGLTAESYAKCEQIQTIPQSRLTECIGELSEPDLANISAALSRTLSLL